MHKRQALGEKLENKPSPPHPFHDGNLKDNCFEDKVDF